MCQPALALVSSTVCSIVSLFLKAVKGVPSKKEAFLFEVLFSGSRQVNVRQSAELPMSQILSDRMFKDGYHCRQPVLNLSPSHIILVNMTLEQPFANIWIRSRKKEEKTLSERLALFNKHPIIIFCFANSANHDGKTHRHCVIFRAWKRDSFCACYWLPLPALCLVSRLGKRNRCRPFRGICRHPCPNPFALSSTNKCRLFLSFPKHRCLWRPRWNQRLTPSKKTF